MLQKKVGEDKGVRVGPRSKGQDAVLDAVSMEAAWKS